MKIKLSLLAFLGFILPAQAAPPALFVIPGGTSVTTTLNNPNPYSDIGLYTTANITTWNIKLPPSPASGQVVNVVCGGGSATTINISTTDSSTVTPSVTTCSSGANFYLQFSSPNNTWVQTVYGSSVSAGVSSISNSDSSLTISPTTGAAVASLNVANANSWTALQTFAANDLKLGGVTGSTQCLHASSTGIVTGTGSDCGSGGSGINFPQPVTGTTNSGGIPYFSNGTTLSSSNALTANALMIGGGAGAAPSTVTTGANVLTALGNAAQAPGGIMTNGGAPILVATRSSSATTVTVSATTDYLLCLNSTSNAITVNLPATPATGLTYLVKDCGGAAATHNITVAPAAGNIDGASTYVLSTNYQSAALTYTGSAWSVN